MFWTTLWNCFTIQRTSSDLEITNLYMNIWNVTWVLSFLSYIMQRFICNEINSHLSTFMSSCSQTFLSHIKWREIIHWTRFMWPQLNYTSCCCRIHLICLERQLHKVAVRLCAAVKLTKKNNVGRRGGHVPQCPIAGDTSDTEYFLFSWESFSTTSAHFFFGLPQALTPLLGWLKMQRLENA